MLNLICIHGRLTASPELKQTPSGVSVCSFTVAVDRSYKNGETKLTDFFTVVSWRGLAEMIAKHFTKGKEIAVWGEMQSRKWQDNDGNTRVAWEIMANGVDFCGPKGADSNLSAQSNAAPQFETVTDDTDLPF